MLVRGVVERAVTRTVGDDRALPHGRDHVHVAGAGLHDEARLRGRLHLPDAGKEAAHQRVRSIAVPRLLPSPEREADGAARPADGDGVAAALSSRQRRGRRGVGALEMCGGPRQQFVHEGAGVKPHWQPPGNLGIHRVGHAVGVGGDEAPQAWTELIERPGLAGVRLVRVPPHPVPQVDNDLGDARVWTRGVGHRLSGLDVHQQPALVAERDAAPAARLADHARGGFRLPGAVKARGDEARALAGGGFLLDRADDHQAHAHLASPRRAEAGASRRERGEGTLCVHAAAAEEGERGVGGARVLRF